MKGIILFKTLDDRTISNKNINVSILPSENVSSYVCRLYKDGNVISSSSSSSVSLEDIGRYKIVCDVKLKDGSVKLVTSSEYIIDREAPMIEVNNDNLVIKKGARETILNNAKAYDKVDGEIKSINVDFGDLKVNQVHRLTYTVSDRAGNKTTRDINVKVVDYDYSFFILCYGMAIFLIFIYFIIRVRGALKIEKRIDAYVLKSANKKEISLSEKFINRYKVFTKKISKGLDRSVFIKRYCRKLERYLPVTEIHDSSLDIFSGKLIFAFIFVFIALIFKLFSFKIIELYEIVLIFTFGFFALDIIYFIKYKMFRRKIESDFTSAITIMNNAFKSGRSITQAIDIVGMELKGKVGEEFNRMSLELLYGLGIDVVFKRFAKRIALEEANYLTASLTILNKTGGDIVKVFDSIEKSMYDKKKLRLELASLTSGSKIVVGVLLGMPFFFCLVIGLINPEYFVPFFTTNIGIILLIFMIIYYIIFVVVVRKVMKVVI